MCARIQPTVAKRDVIHKIGSTQRSAMKPVEDRATATWDLQTKFREMVPAVPEIWSQTDRHTHRDRLITILCTLTGKE